MRGIARDCQAGCVSAQVKGWHEETEQLGIIRFAKQCRSVLKWSKETSCGGESLGADSLSKQDISTSGKKPFAAKANVLQQQQSRVHADKLTSYMFCKQRRDCFHHHLRDYRWCPTDYIRLK